MTSDAEGALRTIRTLIRSAADVEDVSVLHKVHREVLNAVAIGLGEPTELKGHNVVPLRRRRVRVETDGPEAS
jgi:hypothetical protein